VIGGACVVRFTLHPGVPRGLGEDSEDTAGGISNSLEIVSRDLVVPLYA
jgi:hypothetical protein